MCVISETLHHLADVLVDDGVGHDSVAELFVLVLAWELSVDEEVGNLEEIAVFGELLNWVSSVPEDSFVSVDEGNFGGAVDSVLVTWIVVSERWAPIVFDLAEITSSDEAILDWESVLLSCSVVSYT